MGRHRKNTKAVPPMLAVAGSALMRQDAELALLVDTGLRSHYLKTTASTYATGAKDYNTFCLNRGLSPWPVCQVALCGWMHVTSKRIVIPSMRVYMEGIRDASILGGHGWDLKGNEDHAFPSS